MRRLLAGCLRVSEDKRSLSYFLFSASISTSNMSLFVCEVLIRVPNVLVMCQGEVNVLSELIGSVIIQSVLSVVFHFLSVIFSLKSQQAQRATFQELSLVSIDSTLKL